MKTCSQTSIPPAKSRQSFFPPQTIKALPLVSPLLINTLKPRNQLWRRPQQSVALTNHPGSLGKKRPAPLSSPGNLGAHARLYISQKPFNIAEIIFNFFSCSFQPISVCKSDQNKSLNDTATPPPKKAAKLPRKKLAPAPSTDAAIDMDATPDDLISSADSSHRPAAAATAPSHRRQLGKLHTTRVEYLLQKYLGEEAKDVLGAKTSSSTISPAVEQENISVFNTSAVSVLTSKKKVVQVPRREIKSIMQVKSEQDAAVRELQHAPRQFHAKPVPLSCATPRDPLPAPTISVPPKKDVEELVEVRAKPVPPATSEPRYALLVADSVLRRYGASNEEENNAFAAAAAAAGVAPDSGLQKWMSWPGGQDQVQQQQQEWGEAAPFLKRPQTARPGRRSNVDGTHVLLPGIEEEV